MKAQLLSTLFCVAIGCTASIDATTITRAGREAAIKKGYSDADIDFIQAELKYEKGKSLDAVYKALHAGANPNVVMAVETDNGLVKSQLALINAAVQEDREAVRMLLSFNADPTMQSNGLTAIEWAARCQEPNGDILALLLGGVSDVKEKNKALFGSNVRARLFLLEHGADVNAVDTDGETVLMKAIQEWDIDSIQLLLKHKVDVNKKDKKGKTALNYALFEMELTRELIQQNKNDKTAQRMYKEIQQIIKMLEEAGARVGVPHEDRKARKEKKDKRDDE